MKNLVVFSIILLCQNNSVSATAFLDIVSIKMNDFASSIVNTLRSIRNQLSDFFFNHSTVKRPHDVVLHESNKMKQISTRTPRVRSGRPASIRSTTIKEELLGFRSNNNNKFVPLPAMTTPQLVTLHGRRVESHIVLTEDGYLLTLHRVIGPRIEVASEVRNKTVLLFHGLLGSSADWVLLGPKKSLPYLLSNQGYDVWMANSRGNIYSRAHVSLNVNSSLFWRFSWQDIGQQDLPAIIHYIRLVKNTSEPINYIGHSMGATALLVLLSTTPIFNSYFRTGILLAPLAFMVNTQGPLRMFSSVASKPPPLLLQLMGEGEFMPSKVTPDWLATKHCISSEEFCKNPLLFLTGGLLQTRIWDEKLKTRILTHLPAGGSTYTILHYAEIAKNGIFHKFGDKHEEFPLNRINLPIVLISSSDDWLATVPDVKRLYFGIANPIDHYVIRYQNLSHTEFVFGPSADYLVFRKVLYYLDNGLSLSVLKLNEV